MKLLNNKKINLLFKKMLAGILLFTAFSIFSMILRREKAAQYIFAAALVMAFWMAAACLIYFREQNAILEQAGAEIRAYISGSQDARIPCNEEGELYRLFHEINTLAAILNAHIEKESGSRQFLKNTISDISHQLKTPIAALNIYNGILQEGAADEETVREFTALSEQELDRMERLVQNLLKITKLDAGTYVFHKEAWNLSDMMKEIQSHAAFRARQEGKELTLHGSDSLTLLCDRDWLMEAIENIVKNALDHTKKGDRISVAWRQLASVVQITVKDTGSGIHPEDLPHIFKRFYRSRYSKDTQGIGLGLALAKGIVEAHDGTVEVDSELGRGSVFILNFISEPNPKD